MFNLNYKIWKLEDELLKLERNTNAVLEVKKLKLENNIQNLEVESCKLKSLNYICL